jgi:hypothetical protein
VPEQKYSTAGSCVGGLRLGGAQILFVWINGKFESGIGIIRPIQRSRLSRDVRDSLSLRCNLSSQTGCRRVRSDSGSSRLFFALHMIEPLRVGHGRARGQHANPRTVGRLSEEDRDFEAASQDSKPCDVILMLVCDEDGVELTGIFSCDSHALQKFAARETCVHQNTSAGAGDNCAIAFGTGGEHCHTHHLVRIRRLVVSKWIR